MTYAARSDITDDDSVKMAFRSIIRRMLSSPWDEVCRKVVFIAPPLATDPGLRSYPDEGSYVVFMLDGCQRVLYADCEGRKEYVHRPGEVLYLARGINYTICRDTMFRRLGLGAYKRRYRMSYDYHMDAEKPPVPDLWHSKFTSDSSGYFKMFAALDDRARLGESNAAVDRMLPRLLLFSLLEMLEMMPPLTAGSRSEGQFRRIVDYIESNFAKPISRKTLAEHFELSEGYISQLFRENSDKSLSEYLNSVKMEQARQMLETGMYTAVETAAACGFHDPSYFGRVFREYWKISPGSLTGGSREERR